MRAFLLKIWLLLAGGLPLTAVAQNPADLPFTLACRKGARVGGGKEQFCEIRELTMPAPVGQPLIISGATASTGVYGWDGPDVRIQVLVQSGGASPAEAQARVREVGLTTNDNSLRASRPDDGVERLIRYQLFVPRHTALVVTTGGSLRLDHLQAHIEFQGGSGNALLTGMGGQVTGSVRNGNLTVELTGTRWEGEGLDVRTTNGNVRWQLPATYSAQLLLRTTNGSLTTNLPVPLADNRRELTTTVGQGGALLKATTVNGDVSVQQAGSTTASSRAATETNLTSEMERLKRAVTHARPAAYDSLMAQARRVGDISVQVVVLGKQAAQQQPDQPAAAAALLQAATELASQVPAGTDAGWAMGQVGHLQGQLARQSSALATFYAPLLQALSEAKTNNAAAKAIAREADGNALVASETNRLRRLGLNLNNLPVPPTVPSLPPGRYLPPNLGPVSKLLDTLLSAHPASPQAAHQQQLRRRQLDRSQALSTAFARQGNYAKAYQYYVQYSAYKDSLTAEATTRRLAALEYRQNLLKKETQIQRLTREQLLRRQAARRQQQSVVILASCVGLLAVFLFLLSRNNRARRLANAQLNVQKETLQQALTDLKTTQTQLIQSEKMASLGELTAGIAHEIQNPLNFVTNFADVSQELVQELEEAQAAGDGAEVTALAADVRQNLHKISEHGRRAAGIVRGMLAHSRQSSGERQLTDVNALADEYLRLAYHGLRAKDNGFHAILHTDFTPALPLVQAVSGDLGRVLLNLFTNAFYAVQQRQQAGEVGYVPAVRVHTQQVGQQVQIQVQDNGTGMSPEVQAKIFQPFFTTKPTGEGTGLGLSLSYDIVAKGHGGMLAVASEPNQGSTFTIQLPLA